MSRYAMHNPEDPNMEQAIDRADHAKKEARENATAPGSARAERVREEVRNCFAARSLNPAALADLYVALAAMVAIVESRPDIGRLYGFKEWAEHARAVATLAKARA